MHATDARYLTPYAVRRGIDEDERPNDFVLRPDGSIAVALSGLTMSREKDQVIQNVVDWHDEQAVTALLERGDVEKAKESTSKLAPTYEVVKRQAATDGEMSLRTDELDEAEELRDTIRKKRGEAKR